MQSVVYHFTANVLLFQKHAGHF